MQLKQVLTYFGFPNIVYKTKSQYNGEIIVSSVFGQKSISVENLTQSGPIVFGLWSFAISQISNINSCLILGVGGGSVIKVLRKKFPNAKITGVEIDSKMVDIGKKYFNLDKYNTKIIIEDAFKFIQKNKKQYDLICIDLLVGRNAPSKLSSIEFFRNIKKILNNKGTVIINQLRLKGQVEDNNLIKILNRIFEKVEICRPLVNLLIYCKI